MKARRIPKMTARWLVSVFGVIVLILIGFELMLSAVIFSYYQSSAETYLKNRAENLSRYYNSYIAPQAPTLESGARRVAEEFSDLSTTELQVLDLSGRCLYTSIGYTVGLAPVQTSDFLAAREGSTGVWQGKNEGTEEAVAAVSAPLCDDSGQIVGALRLVSSTEAVYERAWVLVGVSAAVCLAIILFVFMTNYYFISSIVSPLSVITETSNKIAAGDLSARIPNRYRDEVGDLCDSINNMAKELAESDRMKNDFISSVSHELRTPLTAIKGWSETMTLCDPIQDKETVSRGLHVINEEVSRLSHMVEELLDFSRIQSGRLKVKMEVMDLYAEVEQVTLILRERAAAAGVILRFDCPERASCVILGDADRLSQVLINVLDNAVKHSPPGSSIEISIEQSEKTVTLRVQDHGEGIRPEDLPRVKERFYKGLSSKHGTGLGLAVADEIVRLHDGELNLQSTWGEGTCVTVSLPRRVPEKEGTHHEG